MLDDAGAYLLLLADLLVVAVVLTLPVLALGWLATRPAKAVGTSSSERVLRRCESCGVGWRGRPGEDASVLALKIRRRARRRTRARKEASPTWAKRRGWSRCPSCLSTKVRTSGRHTADTADH